MKIKLNRNQIDRYSRQIILKNISILGQKKIIESKVLIVGMGGLGCPVAEFLTRAGVGTIGLVDSDKVELSNLHRQSLYNTDNLGQFKVEIAKRFLEKIDKKTKIDVYKMKLTEKNIKKIFNKYDYVIDGTDNFKTKFLINDYCVRLKRCLVVGAINKFDGHIFTFDFRDKKSPCLRCFFQEEKISEDILNCEHDGVIGTIAGVIGTLQANETIKQILKIGKNLNGLILILDLLNLNFRKVKLKKLQKCLCS